MIDYELIDGFGTNHIVIGIHQDESDPFPRSCFDDKMSMVNYLCEDNVDYPTVESEIDLFVGDRCSGGGRSMNDRGECGCDDHCRRKAIDIDT
jgi:hypothetical protein